MIIFRHVIKSDTEFVGPPAVGRRCAVITPLLATSDDPEYCAIYAEIIAARSEGRAASETERAAARYELLLVQRPESYADHAGSLLHLRQPTAACCRAVIGQLQTARHTTLAQPFGHGAPQSQQVSLVQGDTS